MTGKKIIIRSEHKLKDVDPAIQALYDRKMVAILRAQEEEEEQESEAVTELIEALTELACQNSDKIEELAEGLNIKIESREPEAEIREKITKSLEQSGLTGKMVQIGKRIKIIQ